jgi:hypothetical protein
MNRVFHALLVCGVALATAGSVDASTDTQPETVSVRLQPRPTVRTNVHVSFHAGGQLPAGGYYYAVIVLKPYKRYTRTAPPPCATSSNMQRAAYGYPQADGRVSLALTPARSAAGHWCRGGAYLGAVYAVPQPPPCERRYPCGSEPYEPPSPCWDVGGGHRVCGVVARPRRYSYPDGIPPPLAKGTRIVGRFGIVIR